MTVKKGIVAGGVAALGTYGTLELSGVLLGDIKLLSETKLYDGKSGTIGYVYRHRLLDPDARENKSLWSKVEKWAIDNNSGITQLWSDFLKITYEEDQYESLPDICRKTYEILESDLTNKKNDHIYTWANFWRYCSIYSKTVPETLDNSKDNSDYTSGTWGKTNEKNLISIESDEDSDTEELKFVWDRTYEIIFKRDLKAGKKMDEKFAEIKSGEQLKNVCEGAYKSVSKDSSDDYGENARDYCSLSSEKITGYPTKA